MYVCGIVSQLLLRRQLGELLCMCLSTCMLALVTYTCVYVCITRLTVDNPSHRQAATATATQAAATCFLYLTRASLLTFANGFAFAFAPIWPQGILSKREISKRSFYVCV